MIVDFRSDTLTQPSPGMRDAMMRAPLGDDVYGEDPSVNALQAMAAERFGMGAALFCPSGTMCNQIGIRLGTQPQTEVICDQYAHVYRYEAGGIAANSLASVRLIPGDRGRLKAAQIEAELNPPDMHFPQTSLVALENTSNKGGGSCYELAEIDRISALCQAKGLRLHLDGARLFNALVAKGQTPAEMGRYFDTISICLSKGLGAPVGSLLLMARKEDLPRALHIRKLMGGGMRQAGMLAAAGLYALTQQVERLEVDHLHAKAIGQALQAHPGMAEVMPVETNIVIFRPDPNWKSAPEVLHELAEAGIRLSPFGGDWLRLVTHLDISEDGIQYTLDQLKRWK